MTVTTLAPSNRAIELTLADLALPPGSWHEGIWASDAPLDAPDRYLTCVAAYRHTGLWPVLIPADPRFGPEENWVADRERLPHAGADQVAATDPAKVLRQWWDGPCCDGGCLEPFGDTFGGLARRSNRRMDPHAEAGNTGSLLAARAGSRLGLVRTAHPADIPALIGWAGTLNWTHDVAAVSAVLRSWEERFGATLVTLGFDAVELTVAAPPTTRERALAVAAEHRAFCLPNFTSQPGSLREFAEGLVGTRIWRFWWD